MVRRYVGNGVWEDTHVPGTEPKTAPNTLKLDEALEEVATRFLAHLPESELERGDRLFFQIEQAHWFYEDFLADAPGATLPHLHLRAFAAKLFDRVPVLGPLKPTYQQLFEDFRAYKGKIPVAGCILLDPSLTKVVLVQNWAKTSWGLPKGKINQHERPCQCAAREVLEETGYAVPPLVDDEGIESINAEQRAVMFCVPDVDPAFAFEPKVRKEIAAIKFFPLDALPPKQWGVDKFVPKVKRWVKQYRKRQRGNAKAAPAEATPESPEAYEPDDEPEDDEADAYEPDYAPEPEPDVGAMDDDICDDAGDGGAPDAAVAAVLRFSGDREDEAPPPVPTEVFFDRDALLAKIDAIIDPALAEARVAYEAAVQDCEAARDAVLAKAAKDYPAPTPLPQPKMSKTARKNARNKARKAFAKNVKAQQVEGA